MKASNFNCAARTFFPRYRFKALAIGKIVFLAECCREVNKLLGKQPVHCSLITKGSFVLELMPALRYNGATTNENLGD